METPDVVEGPLECSLLQACVPRVSLPNDREATGKPLGSYWGATEEPLANEGKPLASERVTLSALCCVKGSGNAMSAGLLE